MQFLREAFGVTTAKLIITIFTGKNISLVVSIFNVKMLIHQEEIKVHIW